MVRATTCVCSNSDRIDYLAKPFNARELIARAHMQLQLGKRRRALEDAFEERTAELRTLTECELMCVALVADNQTRLEVSSD